jgi:uncharacterized protein
MKYRLRALAVMLALGAGACQLPEPGATPPPDLGFRTAVLEILSRSGTHRLRVEIAETPEQREVGLMHRTDLPPEGGMLFLFDEERTGRDGFWMYRTYVPLSIAFLDGEGTIRAVRDMEPCLSRYSIRCTRYYPGVAHRHALEVNQGYFADRGIGIGDRVLLPRER